LKVGGADGRKKKRRFHGGRFRQPRPQPHGCRGALIECAGGASRSFLPRRRDVGERSAGEAGPAGDPICRSQRGGAVRVVHGRAGPGAVPEEGGLSFQPTRRVPLPGADVHVQTGGRGSRGDEGVCPRPGHTVPRRQRYAYTAFPPPPGVLAQPRSCVVGAGLRGRGRGKPDRTLG